MNKDDTDLCEKLLGPLDSSNTYERELRQQAAYRVTVLNADRDAAIARAEALEGAVRMSLGTYEALRLVGADRHLPGLDHCEKAAHAALADRRRGS